MAALQPILKWAGGKEQELKHILPLLPSFKNYFEPFVGGGAVYTAVKAQEYFINDKSEELMLLYRHIASSNSSLFWQALKEIVHNWDLLTDLAENNRCFFVELYRQFSDDRISDIKFQNKLFEFILRNAEQFNGMFSDIFNFNIENFIREIKINMLRKTRRMKQIEAQKGKLSENDILDNIETSLKSAFYMHFRHIYNYQDRYNLGDEFRSAVFLFIRNFAYSGMFRYNAKGEFNVPYGGIAYNRKDLSKKTEYLKSEELSKHLNKTHLSSLDFEEFLDRTRPTNNDFMFVDPPYDSEFSTYAQNEFSKKDHQRLADVLVRCPAKWMMIIKETDFIVSLYEAKGLLIDSFDKKYQVSFMNRNEKNVQHLLIRNY